MADTGKFNKGIQVNRVLIFGILLVVIIAIIVLLGAGVKDNSNALEKSIKSENVDSSFYSAINRGIPNGVPSAAQIEREERKQFAAKTAQKDNNSTNSKKSNVYSPQSADDSPLRSNINYSLLAPVNYFGTSSRTKNRTTIVKKNADQSGKNISIPKTNINSFNQQNTSIESTPYPVEQTNKLEVRAGSIIPAILLTGINSDLPGRIIAKVRRNVFDTYSGRYILIPQGSTLIGLYSSKVAYGQSRVLVVWTNIIFPNGTTINLKGMPGADLSGYSGLTDQVNNHYFRIFSSAILMSLFTAGIEASQGNNSWGGGAGNTAGLNGGSIIAGALGLQLGETGIKMIEKNLNIQPTIEIRPGDEFNVLVTRDIPFRHPYKT